jgi:hypothetical protein
LKTISLTDKVFLSENEGWVKEGEGWADTWYFPQGADMEKEKVEWEHVWLAKVAYTFNEEFKQNEIKRYMAEIDGVFPEIAHKIDHIR